MHIILFARRYNEYQNLFVVTGDDEIDNSMKMLLYLLYFLARSELASQLEFRS